jgi:hypothetical protein
MMSFFALKISDPTSVDLVNSIKAGSQDITIQQLNQLENELKIGEKVFIQLGGDKVTWEKGLIGLAQITSEPFDKGYDEKNARNFRLGLKMILVLRGVIKREEFRFYVDAYDAGGIGPNTRGEQNQAIKALTDKQAYAILRAMAERQEELADKIKVLFSEDECSKIFGKMTCMVESEMTYEESMNNSKGGNDVEEVFNHRLFGMHIKQQNNALSTENPHVCIGWSAMGDLSEISSKEELTVLYEEHFDKNPRGKGQDVGQVWRFLNDMQIGDYVIFAENSMFHIGRVESDYYYDDTENSEQSADYKSTRKVRWLKKNISRSVLSSNLHKSLMTAMSIFTLNDYKSAVADLLRGTYVKDEERTEVEEEIMDLIFNTSIKTKYERNRIVFGAPGTGKSYKLKADCEEMMSSSDGSFERVTFHPEYSYSQFVGTYKPVMGEDGETIKYNYVPGPFMRMYVEALKSGRTENPQPHLLLIEEINRAKVAAVFGDVFQLLDRDDDGVSEYDIQASEDIKKYLAKELGGSPENYNRIRIPNNMFIWATMNSADQGVFPMDTAFKRRWNFEYLGIDENAEKIADIGKIILEGSGETIEWNRLRKAINAKMSSSEFKINEDKLMGPFFLSKKAIASNENGMIINKKAFIDAFKSKVIMYLYEDAVKQGKHRFFDGCPDTGKYSAVCDAFDKIGTKIFGATFREDFYDKED